MKKLCNGKPTKRVHPSPMATAMAHHHHLSCLPAAVLTLAAALSPEEQEVLAYLLVDPTARRKHPTRAHHADPTCGCFSCYKTFWARWDSSPNRHVIHLIIDAVEQEEAAAAAEGASSLEPKGRTRRRRGGRKNTAGEEDRKEILQADDGHVAADGRGDGVGLDGGDEKDKSKSSSVRRLVSFVGERVWPWGVWN